MKKFMIAAVLMASLMVPGLGEADEFNFQRRLEVQYTIFKEVLNRHGERIRLHKSLEVYGKPGLGAQLRLKQWEVNEAVSDAFAKFGGVNESKTLIAAIHGMVLSYSMGFKHEVQAVHRSQNEEERLNELLMLEMGAERIIEGK